MNSTHAYQHAHDGLPARLENADWEREALVETVAIHDDVELSAVDEVLEDLAARGEVYIANGEVVR